MWLHLAGQRGVEALDAISLKARGNFGGCQIRAKGGMRIEEKEIETHRQRPDRRGGR